jgi:tetratricopeptide (TPR) repeat protein
MNGTSGSQYGQLRERYAEQQRSRLPNADAIEQSRRYNEQILKTRAAAAGAKAADENKTGDTKTGETKPGAAKPDGTAPTGVRPVDDDGLKMPRPTGAPQPAAKPAAPQVPLEIKSLTTGVQDANLKKTLGEAEQFMKAGKFTSAIDAFDRAEAMATADPLVFVGRGVAELGGGYYRNAERHFRQAFASDKSLLLARFDLNEMLSKDRLNYLLDDLGRVANANKNDPGPLVLLAFVYYNVNLPDRASRALDLADQRAGGKDGLAQLFRENWTLKPVGGESK